MVYNIRAPVNAGALFCYKEGKGNMAVKITIPVNFQDSA